MTGLVAVSKEEAATAVRDQAFTIGEEYEGAGRQIIHCFLGSLGADWDLERVLELIERSEDRVWAHDFMGHNLVIQAKGKQYHFDVRRPPAATT